MASLLLGNAWARRCRWCLLHLGSRNGLLIVRGTQLSYRKSSIQRPYLDDWLGVVRSYRPSLDRHPFEDAHERSLDFGDAAVPLGCGRVE